MDTLTRRDLRRLMEHRGEPAVSLYMATDHRTVEVGHDRLVFKNLLMDAERRLSGRGLRTAAVRDLLAPARALLDDADFWLHRGDGLAVFLADGVFERYRTPIAMRELLVIGARLHTKPLLPVVEHDGRYHVLALQKDAVRLFEGSRDAIHEVDLNGAPEELSALIRGAVERGAKPDMQVRTVGKAAGGGPAVMRVTGGSSAEGWQHQDKVRAAEYFRLIDQALRGTLRRDPAPLVLAGLPELTALYRQASTDPHLTESAIDHGAGRLDERSLHEAAWRIVAPTFATERGKWADRLHDRSSRNDGSEDVVTVVEAAREGRVEALFVSLDEEVWGETDPEDDRFVVHPDRREEDEDALDLAAAETMLHGGRVFGVRRDEALALGLREPLGAVFRYERPGGVRPA